MLFPRCPLLDPLAKLLDLLLSQLLVRLGRWHTFFKIMRENALQQRTLFGPLQLDGRQRAFVRIQPQIRLAMVGVGPVTIETVVRKYRTNIALERNLRLLCAASGKAIRMQTVIPSVRRVGIIERLEQCGRDGWESVL